MAVNRSCHNWGRIVTQLRQDRDTTEAGSGHVLNGMTYWLIGIVSSLNSCAQYWHVVK